MRIIQINTFHNENDIAKIQIDESSRWVDDIHITECNRTFQYGRKNQLYNLKPNPKVKYSFLDVENVFKKSSKIFPNIDLKRQMDNKLLFFNSTWYNEMMQRKIAVAQVDIGDNDILILGDIDEIVNSDYAQYLIDEVKKKDVITIKMHFTLFYFNLFSQNWQGAPDYSYRLFLIKGKKFKNDFKCDYDKIRKMGERGLIANKVFCPDIPMGFHHSWLGDSDFISKKLKAYSHIEHSHLDNKIYIQNCIENGVSIFPGHKLQLNNTVKLLSAIEKNREQYKHHFLIAKDT